MHGHYVEKCDLNKKIRLNIPVYRRVNSLNFRIKLVFIAFIKPVKVLCLNFPLISVIEGQRGMLSDS